MYNNFFPVSSREQKRDISSSSTSSSILFKTSNIACTPSSSCKDPPQSATIKTTSVNVIVDDVEDDNQIFEHANIDCRQIIDYHFTVDPHEGMPPGSILYNESALEELRNYYMRQIKIIDLGGQTDSEGMSIMAFLKTEIVQPVLSHTTNRFRIEEFVKIAEMVAKIRQFASKHSSISSLTPKGPYRLQYLGLDGINGMIQALRSSIDKMNLLDQTMSLSSDNQKLLKSWNMAVEDLEAGLNHHGTMKHLRHYDFFSRFSMFKLDAMLSKRNFWSFVLDNGQFLNSLHFPDMCAGFFDRVHHTR